MKFKVGDRVKVVRGEDFDSRVLGKIGTIKEYMGKIGHGWLCSPKNLERITNSKDKIVITSDGKRVIAKLYNDKELIKSAEAKCCPDDKFNFEFGVTLAMGRLFEHESDSDKVKPKELLKNGMFGKHNNYGWFVVVEDKFVCFDGGYSIIKHYNDDLTSKYSSDNNYVEMLVDAPSLNSAKTSAENGCIIWKR